MIEPTMLKKLEEAVASCEGENGEIRGYALITFHDGFYNMECAAFEGEAEAIGVIEDVANFLGYDDEPARLQ